MLLGQVGDVPVIGMPGCARSPKLNGFDWVLQRYLAGLPVVPRDIMRLGPGGLLKDIPTRPLPRAKARPGAADDDEPAPVTRAPKIAAVVLAAGQSRRMGRTNKLLAAVDGVPMLRRTLENVRASKVADIVVVTGHEAEQVDAAIADLGVRSVHNPNYAGGLSTSLATGLGALGADIEGAIVCLGDMPRVAPGVIDRLIAAYDPLEGRAICVPTQGGKRGNPVLWDRRYFAEMQAVSGDVGARHLIGEHADMMVEVEMGDDGVLIDIDTPEALARLAPLNAAASEA
jgi:molybdenum cofactor cytidylyltransferase